MTRCEPLHVAAESRPESVALRGPDDVERAYLEARYQGRKFDLVMTTDDDALAFVVRHHARLFPGMPVVLSDAAAVDTEGLRKTIPVTGVRERLDVPLPSQSISEPASGSTSGRRWNWRDACDRLRVRSSCSPIVAIGVPA